MVVVEKEENDEVCFILVCVWRCKLLANMLALEVGSGIGGGGKSPRAMSCGRLAWVIPVGRSLQVKNISSRH